MLQILGIALGVVVGWLLCLAFWPGTSSVPGNGEEGARGASSIESPLAQKPRRHHRHVVNEEERPSTDSTAIEESQRDRADALRPGAEPDIAAEVSGRVVDLEGKGIANFRVNLMVAEHREGVTTFVPLRASVTDLSGSFFFGNLPAGEMNLTVCGQDSGLTFARTLGFELAEAETRMVGDVVVDGGSGRRVDFIVLLDGEPQRARVVIRSFDADGATFAGYTDGGGRVSFAGLSAAAGFAYTATNSEGLTSSGRVLPVSAEAGLRAHLVDGVLVRSGEVFQFSDLLRVPVRVELESRDVQKVSVRCKIPEMAQLLPKVGAVASRRLRLVVKSYAREPGALVFVSSKIREIVEGQSDLIVDIDAIKSNEAEIGVSVLVMTESHGWIVVASGRGGGHDTVKKFLDLGVLTRAPLLSGRAVRDGDSLSGELVIRPHVPVRGGPAFPARLGPDGSFLIGVDHRSSLIVLDLLSQSSGGTATIAGNRLVNGEVTSLGDVGF